MSANVSILGNIGRAPETRTTADGTFVANFSIASNTTRSTPQGSVKKTDWFRVTAPGKQAETLAKYAKKGNRLLVQGKLTFNLWLSRDGEARVSADVVLQDFEFAGANPARSNTESANTAVSTEQKISQEAPAPEASKDAEERAEMMAVLEEMSSSDEQFAGQY